MTADDRLADYIRATWKTTSRVMDYLVENISDEVWAMNVPELPRKTIRMIGGHIHNTRCMWIRLRGKDLGVQPPDKVSRYRVSRVQLLAALQRSSRGIDQLLAAGLEDGGAFPGRVAWGSPPPDVVHFLTYIVAHEAHHRGQIVMAARQLGHRLPPDITAGLWQWSRRAADPGPGLASQS